MSVRSVTLNRKPLHSDSSEQSTFPETLSEPWPTGASDPYICRFTDTEDSDIGKAYSHAGLLLVITLILSNDVRVHCGRLLGAFPENGGNADAPLCRVGGAP